MECLDVSGVQEDLTDKIEFAQYENETSYEIELRKHFTFENWLTAARKFAWLLSNDKYDEEAYNYPLIEKERTQNQTISERIVLESLPFGEDFFGLNYSNIDVWSIFRAILDAFDPETQIKLDYSNLFYGGWCNEIPEPEDYSVPQTIILTEGKYDAEVISSSIKILYPYMAKFYSFINFSDYKVQGSTNFLTHYFKVFIASGIQNRVIALYDNDSAGLSELVDLEKMVLPNNFRVMHLPDLELANDYPTLGPSGKENMNINGKACSIELFLGQDVLSDNGEFTPIQWKGFIEKVQSYQGEIMRKGYVQEKFREKLTKTLHDDIINESQWIEMKKLLTAIFSVFED